ncbi:MAG: apolipoprotein N-acyltransferase [Deltaproteobacteria bacterium]|nr:apolipoprotein N-acyltransferase [Deltaproteobacteria bacterium]
MPARWGTFQQFFLLLLGALLYTLAAPPYEWSVAGWFALAPLFIVVSTQSPRCAFLSGIIYSVLFCVGMAYWVYFSVAAYFPLGAPFSLFSTVLGYLFFIASYGGCAAAGAAMLMRSASSFSSWLGIPALWVSAEFARTSLFSGFSWELLGYTQYRRLWLIQLADLTGVYGLSFLMAFASLVAARSYLAITSSPQTSAAIKKLPWLAVGFLSGLLALTLRYGAFRVHLNEHETAAPLTVALIQQDTPSAQRWQRVYYARALLQYISATQLTLAYATPHLIVWPEFALGFYLDREMALRAQIGDLTSSLRAPLLVGAPRVENTTEGGRYYNAAYLIAPGGAVVDTYDKIRLLPFAEFRPLGLPTFQTHSPENPSEFTPGARATIFPLGQTSFGVTICYEITYPALTRQLARNGAQFFVNISNESWLAPAGTAALLQHFSMAVFRAVENRRPLARVATLGVSGFIDAVGRIHENSFAQAGTLLGQVVPHTEQTVYTSYGDWFAVTCVGIAGLTLVSVRLHRW